MTVPRSVGSKHVMRYRSVVYRKFYPLRVHSEREFVSGVSIKMTGDLRNVSGTRVFVIAAVSSMLLSASKQVCCEYRLL